jgi:hypothetical protein
MSTAAFSRFFAILTVASQAFVVLVIGVWLAGRWSSRVRRLGRSLRELIAPPAPAWSWVVAVVAALGSLYYSEVAHFEPCRLCWYQRIAMYPLALILGIAAFRRDVHIRRYAIPLAAVGGLISIYHYQLQRFPDQGSLSCSAEAPCTLTWVWEFGYISIPLMALSAFALITTLLLIAREPKPEALGHTEGARSSAEDEVGR